jgi:hypothetical protein
MSDLSSSAEAALNDLTARAEGYLLDRAAWYAVDDIDSDAEWTARERMKASHERLLAAVRMLEILDGDNLLRADA